MTSRFIGISALESSAELALERVDPVALLGDEDRGQLREVQRRRKEDAAPTTRVVAQIAQRLRGSHDLVRQRELAPIEEAKELEQLSRDKNVRLQIGHLERFNPVFTEFQQLIGEPKFIENIRIAPFPKRGTDVDVILDLMIHDIDLVLAVVGEYPEFVECTGVNIITSTADLAKARLRFPSGCIADLTASRVSDKAERKMRIFQSGLYLSLDYGTGQARKLQVDSGTTPVPQTLRPESFQLGKGDALFSEIESFLLAVREGKSPKVTAKDGLNAMEVAWQIKDQL